MRADENAALPELVSLSVQSQWEVHEKFGGVVPELASRAHLKNIIPCLEKVLIEGGVTLDQIDFFAATKQPGLIGCLLVGHTAAKTLSMLYDKPLISCHHIESHLMSIYLDRMPIFPFLSLVVSGGHTSLYRVDDFDCYELIGQAIDDAVGEAFDKGAKLLGLKQPGGPQIDKLAQKGNPKKYPFGKVQTQGLKFSFSGLKSELVRLKQKHGHEWQVEDIAASYQRALLDHLFQKIKLAMSETNIRRLALVGGVAANSELRANAESLICSGELIEVYAPPLQFCTDNAAMVGVHAYRRYLARDFSGLDADVVATSRTLLKKAS